MALRGLWTRLEGFRHDDLASLLRDRGVVRGPLIRGTQHLASSEDFLCGASWPNPSPTPTEADADRHASTRIPENPHPQSLLRHQLALGYPLAVLEQKSAYGTPRTF